MLLPICHVLTIMVGNETEKAIQWVFDTFAETEGFQIHTAEEKSGSTVWELLFGPKTKVVRENSGRSSLLQMAKL